MELPQWLVCCWVPKCRSEYSELHAARFFLFSYALHLVAVVGYLACLAITMSLWGDVLLNEEMVEATYRENITGFLRRSLRKPIRFFVLAGLVLYTILNLLAAVSLLASRIRFTGVEGELSFEEWARYDVFYVVSAVSEPPVLFFMAFSFLVQGLRLQCHVLRGGQLLCRLNVAVAVIVVFYFIRAVMVFVPILDWEGPTNWVSDLDYTAWGPFLSIWGPFGIGSACLIYVMRPLHERPGDGPGDLSMSVSHFAPPQSVFMRFTNYTSKFRNTAVAPSAPFVDPSPLSRQESYGALSSPIKGHNESSGNNSSNNSLS